MSAYTGGEWVADGLQIIAESSQAVIGSATLLEPEESVANARVMAAGPALLAACESVARAVQDSNSVLDALTLLSEGPMDRIRQAIAKATEKSP